MAFSFLMGFFGYDSKDNVEGLMFRKYLRLIC